MKKFLLLFGGLVALALLYYFTIGSRQLTLQIKEEIHKELVQMQQHGFGVTTETLSQEKERVTFTFQDPAKIAPYLQAQGVQLSQADLEPLKGMKMGTNISYNPNAYSAVSFALYPLLLPSKLKPQDKEEQQIYQELQRLFDNKSLMVYVDVNKLGNGFKGYMKDINETLQLDAPLHLEMHQLTFQGELQHNTLSSLTQKLKKLSLQREDKMLTVDVQNLQSSYQTTGTSSYAYDASYRVEHLSMQIADAFMWKATDVRLNSASTVADQLASLDTKMYIEQIDSKEFQQSYRLKQTTLHLKADNFHVGAMQQLENSDPNDQEALEASLKELLSHGIRLEVPAFETKEIEIDNNKMEGFLLTGSFHINKDINITQIQQNPLALTKAMNASLNLSLSNALFAHIAQQPQVMMALMLFPPKDAHGKKIYELLLEDDILTLNGQPLF